MMRVMSGRFSFREEAFFNGRRFATQGIARLADGGFNLFADVAIGADQQLFGGEQHLNVTHARHLLDGVFHLAGAGRAVHAVDDPAVAVAAFRKGLSWRFARAFAAAVVFRRHRAELKCRELRNFLGISGVDMAVSGNDNFLINRSIHSGVDSRVKRYLDIQRTHNQEMPGKVTRGGYRVIRPEAAAIVAAQPDDIPDQQQRGAEER